ncbi:MAG: CBS domain-containing protein [Euryarchaeota archaeon]|nr:CBS domain-containing protein [Euryarchaeota archaeon]
MVTAEDILNQDVVKIDGNELFSKVLSLFKETDAIVIMDGDNYQGMLLKRCLMKPKISLDTKVHTVLTHSPKITPATPIEEIARLMIENSVYHLPVIADEEVIGIVTADDVVQQLTDHKFGSQPIKTIMCTEPLSISPEDTLGKVIDMFHAQDIPYLAVIDHNKIVGAITMDDIIEHVMHPEQKMGGSPGHGDFAQEKKKKLDLPVKSIMQEDPSLLSPETTIRDVHTHMHKFDLTGALIGKDYTLSGIVTHKELLAPFVDVQKQEPFAIQFHHNTKKVEGFDKEGAVHFLREEFLKNYEKFLEFGYLHVSLEQHKEAKEGTHRVVCEIKLSTQKGIFYASHEGMGPSQAMKNTMQAIEHQIRKAKGA